MQIDVDECGYLASNLYVIKAITIITDNLMTYYQDEQDTLEAYLKGNETEFSTTLSAYATKISRY